MRSATVLRAVLAFVVLALSVVVVLTKSPRLGLDLRGGTQIVLESRDSPTVKADRESTEQALEVLLRRVDTLGVTEPSIAQSGDRRVIVELPGVHDSRQAAAVLGRTAQLTFHPVIGVPEPPQGASPSPPQATGTQAGHPGELVLADEEGQRLRLGPAALTGAGVQGATAASVVSALVVTRALAEWTVSRRAVRRRPRLSGMAGLGRVRSWLTERNPDLMRHRRRWLALSAIAVVLAVSGIVARGLDLGVEFTGGRLVEYSTSTAVDPEQARTAIADAGFPRAVVQTSAADDLTVRTGNLSNSEETTIRETITELGGQTTKLRDELIGPSLGDELRRNALIALGVALAAQLLYLSLRFRWTFGAAAVIAMAHDVIILVGVFAWLGKPIDGVFLAALLTVIGYSVNDTVVVFDRVRETWAAAARTVPFARVINRAVLQTLPRTVNTGLGAVFILGALAVLGGDSLTDFAIALLIGIAVGTYSSMFTASPVAIALQARSRART